MRITNIPLHASNKQYLIFNHKRIFFLIICYEQPITFAYKNISATSNKIKEKIFKFTLSKLLLYNQNQCNIINKQCSLDLDVANRVYLDIMNLLKLHQWYK